MKKVALVIVVVLGTFLMFLPAYNALADNAEKMNAIESIDGDPEKKCEKCGGKCSDENCTAKCKQECTKENCSKECTKDTKSCSKENCKKGSCDKSKCTTEGSNCSKSCTHSNGTSTEKSSDDQKC